MKKLIYAVLALVLIACGPETTETQNGTSISYIKKGNGESPVDSLVSMFYIRYTTEDGKVMMESEQPMPLKIDVSNPVPQGELFEVLKLLETGDSVHFQLVASELFQNTFRAPIPDSIPSTSNIQFQISYVEQLTEAEYFEQAAAKAAAAAEKQLVIDAEIIDTYLADNGVEAQTTESGLRYVITEEGSGPTPEDGQMVHVDYTGWVLNGDYFDSSNKEVAMEKGLFNQARQYEPYAFPLGQGQVIKGWDEGIALLNKGAKARLYIPSTLGYGSSNRSQIIKANSILVFDVELVDIE